MYAGHRGWKTLKVWKIASPPIPYPEKFHIDILQAEKSSWFVIQSTPRK